LCLVEDDRGLCLIATAGGMSHKCCRTDAEHLRGGEDNKGEIAADADRGNGGSTQAPDPVEIDEHVQRLENHADQHVAGRPQEMPGQRSSCQILQSNLVSEA
jgi:hypothetical protein